MMMLMKKIQRYDIYDDRMLDVETKKEGLRIYFNESLNRSRSRQ